MSAPATPVHLALIRLEDRPAALPVLLDSSTHPLAPKLAQVHNIQDDRSIHY